MRTNTARAAIAAIALAMIGGAGLATATHAAAATSHYTCTTMQYVEPVLVLGGYVKTPAQLTGEGCDIPGKGHTSGVGKTVSGRPAGWARTRSFSYSDAICPVHGRCIFERPRLLPLPKS